MGFFDEFRATVGEIVDAVVEGVTEAAQTTSQEAKEVASDLKEGMRDGVDSVGPHVRRGIGAAAFAAGWLAREGKRMADVLADAASDVAQPADDAPEAEPEPWAEAPAAEPEPPAYEERSLTEAEEVFARQVFKETLPYDLVFLANDLGFNGRPYTVPHPRHLNAFVIHAGPDVIADPTGGKARVAGQRGDAVFIQQLTHVWQGVHRWRPVTYAVRAVVGQFVDGDEAYRYAPGKAWAEYTPEEQADLVRDWYLSGMPPGGALFPYVRDHVWAADAQP